jgi:phage shock protein A
MSVLGWVANLLHVKASEALSRHEGPEATLAHAYEKQLAGLQELKLHLAEVKAEARALAERLAPLQREAEAAEGAAMAALRSGDEPAAKAALERKADALRRLEPLEHAHASIAAESATLDADAARLRERLERFRTEQEVVKAGTEAAAARAQAAAQLSGSGDDHAGAALREAKARLAMLEAKAAAQEMKLASGVIADPLDQRSPAEKELAKLKAASSVDAELAQLKARMAGGGRS